MLLDRRAAMIDDVRIFSAGRRIDLGHEDVVKAVLIDIADNVGGLVRIERELSLPGGAP